ncbi:MAG: ACT domain-containing protein [Paracoccaceae bacterium]|nr:ACT domain-containing protein [Paracoccaceae bacterium]
MSGGTDLERLIASMDPELRPGVFVFATIAPGVAMPSGLAPVMLFRESEGVTLIIDREAAEEARIAGSFPCRMITLKIHSSLEAVGFLARITGALAQAGISVNPVSAFFHDHLFVPEDRAEQAIELLRGLAGRG